MALMSVGTKVEIFDQKPSAYGVICEVSTWGVVNGHGLSENIAYRVHCETWDHAKGGGERWIGALHVRPQ